jgi:hypothetical protein
MTEHIIYSVEGENDELKAVAPDCWIYSRCWAAFYSLFCCTTKCNGMS